MSANVGCAAPRSGIIPVVTNNLHCIDGRRRRTAVWRRRAAGLALLCCVGAALAAAPAPDLSEARRLLAAGRAEQAAALLERDLLDHAGRADYDYLLGLALLQAEQAGAALFAFERVVMVDPGNIDARVKAAQIVLGRGNAAAAADLLAPVATFHPTGAQQREIERLRGLIGAAAGGADLVLRGYALAGIGWDDNITSGPDRSALIVPVFGPMPTQLGGAARDHDRHLVTEAGLSLRAALGEDTWLTGVGSFRQHDNHRRKDVKEGVADLDLGILRRSGEDFLGATLLAQGYLLGSTLYRSTVGARGSWLHPVDARSRLTGYVQCAEFDYPDHVADNARRSVVGAMGDSVAAAGGSAWQYGAYVGRETAHDPPHAHFGYRLFGMHLADTLTLRDDLTVAAAALWETHRHVAADGLHPDIHRRDSQLSLGVAADYALGGNWHLVPRYTYTRNLSNIELYQYARNTFALQLRWNFDNGKN